MEWTKPSEIAEELHKARTGAGETVLREYHEWTNRSVAAGTTDIIPEEWKLTKERADFLWNIMLYKRSKCDMSEQELNIIEFHIPDEPYI